MNLKTRLLFGPLAAALLTIGIVGLASLIPDYSHVRQTVSEIGEVDSPVRIPFTILLCGVATCILVFAFAVRDLSRHINCSTLPAYLIGAMALSVFGVGLFAHPHPLHNVFGISELIGYQAPLAFAVTWRKERHSRNLIALSWITYLLLAVAIVINLSSLSSQGVIWSYVKPMIGIAQRVLFILWFSWITLTGLFLFHDRWHKLVAASSSQDGQATWHG